MQKLNERAGEKQATIVEPRGEVAVGFLADREKFAQARKRRAARASQGVSTPSPREVPWFERVLRRLAESWARRRRGLGGSRSDRVPIFSVEEWLAMGGWRQSDGSAPPSHVIERSTSKR